jgi:hypothetical protein
MKVELRDQRADLEYSLRSELGGFIIERAGRPPLRAVDEGRLLFQLEQDLTLALQRLRRDLYFLHSASVGVPEGAVLFVGDSGAGKSTLTWGLLHHGFGYLSDELAPIDAQELRVLPYPRALCLKDPPPEPYALPPAVMETSRGLHVRVGGDGCSAPAADRLHAIFFLEPGATARRRPAVRPISRGEAAARLLANVLNPLSHACDGLDTALAIARGAPCFALRAGDLRATCDLVGGSLEELRGRAVDPPAGPAGV